MNVYLKPWHFRSGISNDSAMTLVSTPQTWIDSEQNTIHRDTRMSWYEQGQVLASQGLYAEALETFNRAIHDQPENHEIWVFRSIILIHLENYLDALSSCDRALEIQPDSPQAWTLRGVALHRLDRYQEAYSSYERALGIRHRSTPTHFTDRLKGVWKSLIMKLYFNPQQD
ncbi:MAG: tetratricopeptide repeat protein [Elainellaceae cyanobacterium]